MDVGPEFAPSSQRRPDQGVYGNRSAVDHPKPINDPTAYASFDDQNAVSEDEQSSAEDCWIDYGKAQYNKKTKESRHKCNREGCAGVTIKAPADLLRHYLSKHGGARFQCPVEGCCHVESRKDKVPGHIRKKHHSEPQKEAETSSHRNASRGREERRRLIEDAELDDYTY
jgi:hypothetical protein